MNVKRVKDKRNILSIESAVADGSVAIIREAHDQIAIREGAGCARAEKILSVIDGVLAEAHLTLKDIDLIAVSTGPGSYSGIRIGMATALGLANGLNIPCIGVSVLEALAFAAETPEPLVSAIPVGKNDVAWQAFDIKKAGVRASFGEPKLSSSFRFVEELEGFKSSVLYAQTELLSRLIEQFSPATVCVDAGTGLAGIVGRFASSRNEIGAALRPIYLRNKDATGRPAAF